MFTELFIADMKGERELSDQKQVHANVVGGEGGPYTCHRCTVDSFVKATKIK